MITINELFSGIGAQVAALFRFDDIYGEMFDVTFEEK